MRYLLLLYDEPGTYDHLGAEERRALLDEYRQLSEALVAEGAYLDANPLQPVAAARTVRTVAGEVRVEAGLVLESQTTLGGYY